METGLTLGLQGRIEKTVTAGDTAAALGSGDLPVLATPALVAWLEAAASAAVASHLPPGTTTVGTALAVSHLAATPIGLTVTAEATLTAIEGRKLTFRVEAQDSVERIGEGSHTRYQVQVKKFMARTEAKARPGGTE